MKYRRRKIRKNNGIVNQHTCEESAFRVAILLFQIIAQDLQARSTTLLTNLHSHWSYSPTYKEKHSNRQIETKTLIKQRESTKNKNKIRIHTRVSTFQSDFPYVTNDFLKIKKTKKDAEKKKKKKKKNEMVSMHYLERKLIKGK